MGQEIEVKLRIADPDGLRRRLDELGTAVGDVVAEENWLVDTAQRELFKAGCGLRVRSESSDGGRRARLTFKGPTDRTLAAQGVKSREELETDIADPQTILAIFDRLGLRIAAAYQKRRRTWRVDDCEVVLDELPRLGWFAEIEAPDVAALRDVQRRLALQDTPAEPANYVELTVRHGDEDADGARVLRFE